MSFVHAGVGRNFSSNNNAVASPFSNTSLLSLGGELYAGRIFDQRCVWRGDVPGLLRVENDVGFNADDELINIVTTVTHTAPPASGAFTNVAFARFVDADVVAAPGDSAVTNNTRGLATLSRRNFVVSVGTASGYALGLYSASSIVNSGFSTTFSQLPSAYYSFPGTDSYLNLVEDAAIGLGWSIAGALQPGGSFSVQCA